MVFKAGEAGYSGQFRGVVNRIAGMTKTVTVALVRGFAAKDETMSGYFGYHVTVSFGSYPMDRLTLDEAVRFLTGRTRGFQSFDEVRIGKPGRTFRVTTMYGKHDRPQGEATDEFHNEHG